MKGSFRQSGADAVKPEIATRLAKDGLVVVVHLLVANAARIDRRRGRVLRVENHRLARRVDPFVGHHHWAVDHVWM